MSTLVDLFSTWGGAPTRAGAGGRGHSDADRSMSMSSTSTARRRRPTQERNGATVSGRNHPARQQTGTRNAVAYRTQASAGVDHENVSSEQESESMRLLTQCAEQIQKNLKSHISSPSTLYTLASYYTNEEPYVEGRPFCVTLSYATFLYHMQMSRISEGDVQLYVQLIISVLSQIPDSQRLSHPFVTRVLRDAVFGLPSPTCRGGAHCVVLAPPQQYRGFAFLVSSLIDFDVVPLDILYQWQDQLEVFCKASSPIVANRALALLVRTTSSIRVDEQITALQCVLRSRPKKVNIDFLLACYERLQRAVTDAAGGPSFCRAIAIHCSELFLRFRSPIRREYVERFLYPSVCHEDMQAFTAIPATRYHLCQQLLRQCTQAMGTSNPYYLSICAIMQSALSDPLDGAIEMVALLNCQMPHAAYFLAALAVDTRMSVSVFAKVIIALTRGAGIAMTGHESADEVADALEQNRTSVYNVLFSLREVVRHCSVTSSRRASDMLRALRVAMPMKTIEALGQLSIEAFDGHCDIAVDPQLLCAELAMVLHELHISDAMDAGVDYFRDAAAHCHFCNAPKNSTLLCPVNGTVHLTGQSSVGRVLSTLAECSGSKAVEEVLIRYLRDPKMQVESAVHFLVFHILSHAGQHRIELFMAVEPYLRSTLMALITADRTSTGAATSSIDRANILALHVKVAILLANATDPSYWESILNVMAGLSMRNNHDALVVWYLANLVLRNAKGNVELMPTDPAESSYAVNFPSIAPTSTTTADNAQLILKILDRAHSFSESTKKLVGCCVCKLIQDFNMQASNIVMSLLSPLGFIPVGLETLSEFALPVGAGSTFWSFVLRQMRQSAPARTALMTALAKSMSRRFRIATPADAVSVSGVEMTGHVFTVMTYEAMKRSAPLARVILFLLAQWMKQQHPTPGKYACLVYMCVQLSAVILQRGEGPAGVETQAETREDVRHFTEALQKVATALRSQVQRLRKAARLVKEDNREFYRLLRRLERKAKSTVYEVTGERVATHVGGAADPFTDYLSASESEGGFEEGNDPVDALWGRAEEDASRGETSSTARGEEREAFLSKAQRYRFHRGEDAAAAKPGGPATFGSDGGAATNLAMNGWEEDNVVFDTNPLEDDDDFFDDDSRAAERHGAHQQEKQQQQQRINADHRAPAGSPTVSVPMRVIRRVESEGSRSVGVQTSNSPTEEEDDAQGDFEDTMNNNNDSRGVASQTHSKSSSRHAYRHLRYSTDRATQTDTTASASRASVQTAASAHSTASRTHHSHSRSHVDSTRMWREPSFGGGDDDDDDGEPIAQRSVPRLQAVAVESDMPPNDVETVCVPSDIIMEYLKTHQSSQSLFHELQQFDQSWLLQQAYATSSANGYNEPHQAPRPVSHESLVPVTMERRPNNYDRPHSSGPAPSVRVLARMQYVVAPDSEKESTTKDVSRDIGFPSGPAGDATWQKNAEVNDGLPTVAVGGPGLSASNKKHRPELNPMGPVAPPLPTSTPIARGAQYFLNQSASTVLRDFEKMRQNAQSAGDSGGPVDPMLSPTAAERPVYVDDQSSRGSLNYSRPTAAPVPAQLSSSSMQNYATPAAQIVIPACFVEQRNDTAVREIQQVMGTRNVNVQQGSGSSRKRLIRGSDMLGGSGSGVEKENSSMWWTEVSQVPMPEYATDPQYSMELF